MTGTDARERRIIEILSGVYGLSFSELSRELRIRESTLRLILRRMERKGLVVVEKNQKNKDFVRFTGYRKEEGERDDPMFV